MRVGRMKHPILRDGELTQLIELGYVEPDGTLIDHGDDFGPDLGFDETGVRMIEVDP